jgi:hypothetical protein
MKAVEFFHAVAATVSKTAGQPLRDVSPDADILSYFDPGADQEDQEKAAAECATEILFEAGYPVEV